ncbi:nickel pincer cofactor biosynthesis protein LarC [Gemmiger sp.]
MNRKTLYLECQSGISGDMVTAALLDLGADEAVLRKALASLPLDGFDIKISRVKKSGLDACDFDVVLDAEHENHDHDMAYLYGDAPAHCHEHEHHHDHEHPHAVGGGVPDAPHDHEHHHHEHRGLAEVLDILNRADLTDRARATAVRIFTILGEAEAKAHGATLETVHFHEVGAVDSIVDITAAAVCLDNLGVEDVIIPVLCEGTGTVRCAHGVLPIPVPAVANIAAAEHLNLHITHARGEYVTPTGAAIAAAIRTSETLPPEFTVEKIGLGAGKREQELPGFVRAMFIRPAGTEHAAQDTICKLETNIDDCTGEALGYVMERLLAAGARDVYYTPVYMKKNRPAYLLAVLCLEEDVPAMEQIIFAETTTIGIRRVRMERSILTRRIRTVQTSLGSVQVKECEVPCGEDAVRAARPRCYPEYESVKELCRLNGCTYQDALRTVLKEIETEK